MTFPKNQTKSINISRRKFIIDSLSLLTVATLPIGCQKSSVESKPEPKTQPKLIARPGSPTIIPTKGYNQLDFGGERNGFLYRPQSYSSETTTPLFIALHGAGGTANGSWYSCVSFAEAKDFVLLAPDSRAFTWDLILNDYGPDIEFINQALMYTFKRCRIDPTRIAFGGFSDGASYALSLGTANGDFFSHIIAYSPGFIIPSDSLEGKPKIFVSHGLNDNILPVTNSQNIIVPYLINLEYDVVFKKFEGDHEISSQIIDLSLDWFLKN